MPRLNDAEVARLLAGLGGQSPTVHDAPAISPPETEREAREQPSPEPRDQADEITRLQASVATALSGGALRGALESTLLEYVRRGMRLSVTGDAPQLFEPLRFEGGEPLEWHLDIAGPLASALGDAIIGGDGANVRHVNRRRLGRLLEPLATRLTVVVADATGAHFAPLRFIEHARRAATPLAGGTIEFAAIAGGWSVGAALRAPSGAPASSVNDALLTPALTTAAAPERQPLRPESFGEQRLSKPPRDVVHPVMEPVIVAGEARQSEAGPARERVIAGKPFEQDGAFAGAVAAACSRLAEITRSVTEADAVTVTRVETPSLSRDDLKLALISGGQGSLVLSADREAVTNLAAATVGAQIPSGGKPGAVVVDAVEAVLRAALRGFAESLPGVAGGPQRFVRLAEGALPARSPHYAIAAPLRIGDRTATLHWLVPTWMATAKGEERAGSDGR